MKTQYIPYRKIRGSNQHQDRYAEVRIKPRINCILALLTILFFFYYLLSLYIPFVANNLKQSAIHHFQDALKMVQEEFNTVAEAPGLAYPMPRVYAYELMHQVPAIPVETAKDIIFREKHADILWRIYGLESSYGKNDDCLKQGLYNGYGYRQNSSEWMCYKSFQEVTDHVEKWIEDHQDLSLGKLLCLYNTGKYGNCEYSQNFIKL